MNFNDVKQIMHEKFRAASPSGRVALCRELAEMKYATRVQFEKDRIEELQKLHCRAVEAMRADGSSDTVHLWDHGKAGGRW